MTAIVRMCEKRGDASLLIRERYQKSDGIADTAWHFRNYLRSWHLRAIRRNLQNGRIGSPFGRGPEAGAGAVPAATATSGAEPSVAPGSSLRPESREKEHIDETNR